MLACWIEAFRVRYQYRGNESCYVGWWWWWWWWCVRICTAELNFCVDVHSIPANTSEELKDLLRGLLKRNPADRLDFRKNTPRRYLNFLADCDNGSAYPTTECKKVQ